MQFCFSISVTSLARLPCSAKYFATTVLTRYVKFENMFQEDGKVGKCVWKTLCCVFGFRMCASFLRKPMNTKLAFGSQATNIIH